MIIFVFSERKKSSSSVWTLPTAAAACAVSFYAANQPRGIDTMIQPKRINSSTRSREGGLGLASKKIQIPKISKSQNFKILKIFVATLKMQSSDN
jgi:hypothetical protein